MDWQATTPLGRWEKRALVIYALSLIAFGVLVEYRSAFLSRRMGDLDVFLRAAWAVRNDADLYAVTSDNDWHYLYPPLYAILLTPLADPPHGEGAAGYLPYVFSVAICYLVSLLSLFLGVHTLASALEERADDRGFQTQPRYCRRWWALRLVPVLVCGLPICHTLMRGQVNVLVLAMLCAALAGWVRQQKFRAGLWLALAICIKVIPAFLLVYPLWNRDGRALAGCLVGCLAGLVLIPMATFGPARAATHYETYARVFFGPFFNITDDDRHTEEITTTDSIGVKNALHNWMYPGEEKYDRAMHPIAKAVYLLLGFAMTFLTLWPRASSSSEMTPRTAHQLGGLILLMAIFSPVCHMHYLLFCVPIVMSLLFQAWERQSTVEVPWLLTSCFVVFNVTLVIAHLPGLEFLKSLCIGMFATLPFWVIPVVQMWRGPASAMSGARPYSSPFTAGL